MSRCSLSTVSVLWLSTSGTASMTVCSASRSPLKSGISTSISVPGERRRLSRMVWAKMPGATVVEVVAIDRGDDSVLEIHLMDRLCGTERLEDVELGRLARRHIAERAGPGALVPEDHQGGGPHSPALVDVGAVGLFAHGVELQVRASSSSAPGSRRRAGPSPSSNRAGVAPRVAAR